MKVLPPPALLRMFNVQRTLNIFFVPENILCIFICRCCRYMCKSVCIKVTRVAKCGQGVDDNKALLNFIVCCVCVCVCVIVDLKI
jgi:hypothetical protein